MTEDQSLLHQYVREGSRPALDQIVRRHIALVYSSALRQVRDPDLSQDITQAVFLVLAQKARTIRSGVALAGWLLAVTRRACVDAMRRRAIQRRHELAAAKNESIAVEADYWAEIEPLLDAAMDRLPAVDRDAIVLRYFNDRSFADVGTELGVSEDTARRRVSRAVEKLRMIFAKDRVALPAAAISGAIAVHATAATVPPALVTTIISGTAFTTLGTSIAKGAITMMAWTKAKIAASLIAGSLIIAGGGAAIVTIALAQPAQTPSTRPTTSPTGDWAAIQGTWYISFAPDLTPDLLGRVKIEISESDMKTVMPDGQTNMSGYVIDTAPDRRWIDSMTPQGLILGTYQFGNDNTLILRFSTNGVRPPATGNLSLPNVRTLVLNRNAPTTQVAAVLDPRQLNARLLGAKTDLANLETALDAFEIDNGRYPTAAEGLSALLQRPPTATGWHGPYVRQMPADPWGQSYRYVYPGVHNRSGFDLWSSGPDQTDSTADDIGNWP
jgi:type II secretion system protein G